MGAYLGRPTSSSTVSLRRNRVVTRRTADVSPLFAKVRQAKQIDRATDVEPIAELLDSVPVPDALDEQSTFDRRITR